MLGTFEPSDLPALAVDHHLCLLVLCPSLVAWPRSEPHRVQPGYSRGPGFREESVTHQKLSAEPRRSCCVLTVWLGTSCLWSPAWRSPAHRGSLDAGFVFVGGGMWGLLCPSPLKP